METKARDASGNRPVGDALRHFQNRLSLMQHCWLHSPTPRPRHLDKRLGRLVVIANAIHHFHVSRLYPAAHRPRVLASCRPNGAKHWLTRASSRAAGVASSGTRIKWCSTIARCEAKSIGATVGLVHLANQLLDSRETDCIGLLAIPHQTHEPLPKAHQVVVRAGGASSNFSRMRSETARSTVGSKKGRRR